MLEVRSGGCPVQRSRCCLRLSRAFGSAPCSSSTCTASACARFRGGVQSLSILRAARADRSPGAVVARSPSEAPQLRRRRPPRMRRRNAQQSARLAGRSRPSARASSENPWSCATFKQRRRQLASGSVRRSSCRRSLASFFRYSSEARSGSCESGHDPSFRCARRPRLSGWKSGCLTRWCALRVGSTLYADRRPPFGRFRF